MTPAVAKAVARHAESHGKKIINDIFCFFAAGEGIFLCSSVKNPWLKKRDLFDFIGSKSVMMYVQGIVLFTHFSITPVRHYSN